MREKRERGNLGTRLLYTHIYTCISACFVLKGNPLTSMGISSDGAVGTSFRTARRASWVLWYTLSPSGEGSHRIFTNSWRLSGEEGREGGRERERERERESEREREREREREERERLRLLSVLSKT